MKFGLKFWQDSDKKVEPVVGETPSEATPASSSQNAFPPGTNTEEERCKMMFGKDCPDVSNNAFDKLK
ncbi:MAG: hypothetical protein WCO10_03420 [bacterium]